MNDKIKVYLHENYIGIMFTALCLALALVFLFCFRGGKPPNNTNISTTIREADQNTNTAGATIKEAEAKNREARDAIERANAAIGASRERVRELQTELRIISSELNRCLELNLEAQNELKSIKGTGK